MHVFCPCLPLSPADKDISQMSPWVQIAPTQGVFPWKAEFPTMAPGGSAWICVCQVETKHLETADAKSRCSSETPFVTHTLLY